MREDTDVVDLYYYSVVSFNKTSSQTLHLFQLFTITNKVMVNRQLLHILDVDEPNSFELRRYPCNQWPCVLL